MRISGVQYFQEVHGFKVTWIYSQSVNPFTNIVIKISCCVISYYTLEAKLATSVNQDLIAPYGLHLISAYIVS